MLNITVASWVKTLNINCTFEFNSKESAQQQLQRIIHKYFKVFLVTVTYARILYQNETKVKTNCMYQNKNI